MAAAATHSHMELGTAVVRYYDGGCFVRLCSWHNDQNWLQVLHGLKRESWPTEPMHITHRLHRALMAHEAQQLCKLHISVVDTGRSGELCRKQPPFNSRCTQAHSTGRSMLYG